MLCPYCSSKQYHRYGWYTYHVKLQRFKCNRCGKLFTTATPQDLPHYRHSLRIISLAVKSYLHYGLSFRKVAELLYDLFKLRVSHVTIKNWLYLFWKQSKRFQRGLKLPISGTWHLDETFVKLQGHWHYVFAILNEWRRTLLTLRIMPRRTRQAVIKVLKRVKTEIWASPKMIVTDGLASYPQAIHRVFPHAHHQQYVRFRDHPPNNVIERFFSTFKPRYHLLRGFKSLKRAQEFLDAFGFYYNYLRPHKSLRGDPPAESYWGGILENWEYVLRYRP